LEWRAGVHDRIAPAVLTVTVSGWAPYVGTVGGSDAFTAAQVSGAHFSAVLEKVEAHRAGAVAWAAVRAVSVPAAQ
jgi:hypothetical protein